MPAVPKQTRITAPSRVYPNLRPLEKDTVSFKSLDSNKTITDKTYYGGLGPKIKKVLEEAEEPRKDFERTLKKIFAPYCNFDNNIPSHEVGTLIFSKKSKNSLREKFVSRQIRSAEEAKDEIRDIIRGRIILDTPLNEDGANCICNALKKAVNEKKIKIVNIKSYYEMDKKYTQGYDLAYIPFKSLLKLDDAVTEKYGESVFRSGTPRENGYNAVHIIFELTNGYYAELQIMGKNVEKVKEMEDIIYKIKGNKSVPEKYREVLEAYNKFVKGKSAREKELNEYTRRVYNAERLKELGKYENTEQKEFLPLPANSKLPRIFDFNNLAKIYRSKD